MTYLAPRTTKTYDRVAPAAGHTPHINATTGELRHRDLPPLVMLAPRAAKLGDVLIGDESRNLVTVDDARRVLISDAYTTITDQVYEIPIRVTIDQLTADQKATLAQVAPRTPAVRENAGRYSCADGWVVTGHRPVAEILGPQAEQLITLAAAMKAAPTHDPTALRYDHYRAAMKTAYLDAALAALVAVGADVQWWRSQATCADGGELVALAARDLIGTVPGWSTTAYRALMTPWVTTHGAGLWPHPDDPPDEGGKPRPVTTDRRHRTGHQKGTPLMPHPDAQPADETTPHTLTEPGAVVAEHIRKHFPVEEERHRQVLALAEEAGEFVGAYRRWAGMARRTGDFSDVQDELADVVITAYVTAHVLNIDLDAAWRAKARHILTRGWRDRPDGDTP
ncbi:hypothetical protein [Actinomadura litoris]|uniref:NTP pyrophosphohydrolase MazG putative catalytic core domain-containing protein n=1 Tax=Actinomadura litoris TaxID=2678616 RepID=A0A7K1L2R9_9ACTN|nr:hypothetical protein [Actinomadura litoris]MUN38720.1 hypothetical protein [Actinomadura litoris]